MNIPSLSRRRSEPAQDINDDGRIDGHDGTPDGGRPTVTDRDTDATTYRSSNAPAVDAGAARQAKDVDADRRDADADAHRRAAERGAAARAATARSTDDTLRGPSGRAAAVDDEPRTPVGTADHDGTVPAGERTVDLDRSARRTVDPRDHADADEPTVVAGPKPRASLLATLGLIVAVAGALFVLTGTLAGYGIGLGAVGAVLAVFGLMATRRRHIAGKTDALIGMLVGLAAVVLGVVAMTGQFDWPTADGDWVGRFREWLDSQFVDRF